jgi:hypothetical protein
MILTAHNPFPRNPTFFCGMCVSPPKIFIFWKKLFSPFFSPFFSFFSTVRTPSLFLKKFFNHKSTGYKLFFTHTSKKEEKRPKKEKKAKKRQKNDKKSPKKSFFKK